MYIMGTLLRHGNAEQKQRYLPGIAQGHLRLQAFGVTEPTSGTGTYMRAPKRPPSPAVRLFCSPAQPPLPLILSPAGHRHPGAADDGSSGRGRDALRRQRAKGVDVARRALGPDAAAGADGPARRRCAAHGRALRLPRGHAERRGCKKRNGPPTPDDQTSRALTRTVRTAVSARARCSRSA